MFNRSLKWLAGAALSTAALAAVPSFSLAHAHYTGTLPPSLMALTTSAPVRHASKHVRLVSHHSHAARKLSASKKAHKLSKRHHHLMKHRKSALKHRAV